MFSSQTFLNISRLYSRTVSTHQIVLCTLIPGDGVGPDLVHSVKEVFSAANIPIQFETCVFSEIDPLKSETLEHVTSSIRKNRVCLQGIVATPVHSATGDLQNLNMKLRQSLDLFANVVHVKSLPGIKCRHNHVDCVIIREQMEGEYSALEHEIVKGHAECLKIVTKKKSERIAKFAFDYATYNHRKKVTAIHKATILKLGDGLFLNCCQDISKHYPKIEFQKMLIDNCVAQMVSKPHQFEVIVTPNLFGSIVDNIGAALVGGAGVVAGATYSKDCVIFEPGAQHPFLGAAGMNVANPTAMLLCSAKLLKLVNLSEYGNMIKKAVLKVLADEQVKTRDIGGEATTSEFTSAVIRNLDLSIKREKPITVNV